jgi:formylglycine-generating enzyme required for sulfatase activity
MARKCCGIVLILVSSLAFTIPSSGAQETGKKLALLVGIDRYPSGSGFSSLPFPQRDVDQLAQLLVESGYRAEHVRVLSLEKGSRDDPRFLPSQRNILAEFRLLAGDRKPQDSVLVALVGHGLTRKIKVKDPAGNEMDRSAAYFCPQDADIRETPTMISLDELYAELERCKAGTKVMLVDACRDNPTEGNTGAIPFAPPAAPASVAALFSCSDGEVAWEEPELAGGHGVFFHFVIEGLKGAADSDHNDKVSLFELVEYTQDKVPDFVSHRRGRRQMPVLLGRAGRVTLLDRSGGSSAPEFITTRVGQIKLKRIPAGQFLMGSAPSDKEADDDEKPWHWVRITQPFYLGIHEVTRGQFRRFVDEASYRTEAERDGKGGFGWNEETKKFEQNPRYDWQNAGFDQTDEHPVVNVSWNDAQAFITWLSRKEGKAYRLPTEAEWEYACRAGSRTRYWFGDDPEGLAAVGNVADGTAREKYPDWTLAIAARDGYIYTAPVGRFRPNAWGLFDMHGNVWEWCSDGYDKEYYKQSPMDDPQGALGASSRVVRGGGWSGIPRLARSARRGRLVPGDRDGDLGFRVALVQSFR